MSASLVGSEMCIRDMTLPVARPFWKLARGSGVCFDYQRPPFATRGAARCLLYTSDAADDM
eukprot:909874-Alexandrium_andersonii.AAC.1